jgi:hypothetical protein
MDIVAMLLGEVVAGVHCELSGSGDATHCQTVDRSHTGDGVRRKRPGIGVKQDDGSLVVDVDDVDIDLPPIAVGVDESRVEMHPVNVDRLALRPFELPVEAVTPDDLCIAWKVRDLDEEIQVFVLSGHPAEQSVHSPATHHPARDPFCSSSS